MLALRFCPAQQTPLYAWLRPREAASGVQASRHDNSAGLQGATVLN